MHRIYGIGHRTINEVAQTRKLISDSLDYFLGLYGEITCVSSLASGADTYFIEEAIKKNCKIEIVLPFQIEAFENDFSAKDLHTFREIIAKTGYSVMNHLEDETRQRDELYQKTGLALIRDCDIVLAMWDGKQGNGIGGTNDQLQHAVQCNKIIHWIKVSRDNANIEDSDSKMQEVNAAFDKEDRLAIALKKKYHRSWTVGILSALATIFIIECNFNYVESAYVHLACTLFGLFSLFIAYQYLTKVANLYKQRFVAHRYSAETCRAEIWKLNLHSGYSDNFFSQNNYNAQDLFFESQKRQLWIYVQNQISYQKNKRQVRFKKHLSQIENSLLFLRILFCASLLLQAILYAFSIYKPGILESYDLLHQILGFNWMAIPPLYASLEGVMYFNEWRLNIHTSEELMNIFVLQQRAIVECRRPTELKQVEGAIYETFTYDVGKWYQSELMKKTEFKI